MNDVDLDAILNQALDDFEEQAMSEKLAKLEEEAAQELAEEEAAKEKEEKLNNRIKMEKLMQSMQDPSYGPTLQHTLQNLSTTKGGDEEVGKLFDQLAKQFEQNMKPTDTMMPKDPGDANEIEQADREIASTLQMIGTAQEGMQGFEAGEWYLSRLYHASQCALPHSTFPCDAQVKWRKWVRR